VYQQLYNKVLEWIPEKSRVLDLGAGDGEFLWRLVQTKRVAGEGVELDPELVTKCIQRGLVAHQGDILDGLDQYGNGSFDYVLLLSTLQELADPRLAVREALRVGKRIVVSYSNFAYWQGRLQLMFRGRAPVTQSLPSEWYATANTHFCSVLDFDEFCRAVQVQAVQRAYFNRRGEVGFWPNLRAEMGLSMLEPAAS
jgi:methionine biosynthesis protein MetW